MLCVEPYRVGVAEYRCGVCPSCLSYRRSVWVSRLLLEASCHRQSVFVTLTYDEVNLPDDKSVSPRHMQLFLKRLRWYAAPAKVRFYGVGEYGSLYLRPHYHLALFGDCSEDMIYESWQLGFVQIGDLNEASAQYLCGYVLKHMVKHDDPRLCGRHPEFARMSLRPGIGGLATEVIGDACVSKSGSRYLAENGDVPRFVRSQSRKRPVGRYLLGRIRSAVGVDDLAIESVLDAHYRELAVELREPGARAARESRRLQHYRNAVGRAKIFRSKEKL